MQELILGSGSPYRKQLLERLGITFKCHSPNLDENELKQQINNPTELSLQLSVAKAKIIQKEFPEAIIIGSDQVCHIEGEILGKSGSSEKALEQLEKLSGKTHELVTSYAILFHEQCITHTNVTRLCMRKLNKEQIKNYVNAENPIDCAGSYKLELKGISLMESIETQDYTAIIGLPLLALSNDLIKLGLQIPPEL